MGNTQESAEVLADPSAGRRPWQMSQAQAQRLAPWSPIWLIVGLAGVAGSVVAVVLRVRRRIQHRRTHD